MRPHRFFMRRAFLPDINFAKPFVSERVIEMKAFMAYYLKKDKTICLPAGYIAGYNPSEVLFANKLEKKIIYLEDNTRLTAYTIQFVKLFLNGKN